MIKPFWIFKYRYGGYHSLVGFFQVVFSFHDISLDAISLFTGRNLKLVCTRWTKASGQIFRTNKYYVIIQEIDFFYAPASINREAYSFWPEHLFDRPSIRLSVSLSAKTSTLAIAFEG